MEYKRNVRRQILTLLVRNFENQSLLNAFVKYCNEHNLELHTIVLENEQKEASWKLHGDYIISAFVSDTIALRS